MSEDKGDSSQMFFTNASHGGNLYISSASNSGAVFVDGSEKLRRELEEAKRSLARAQDEYIKLHRHCQILEHEVRRLVSMKPTHSFSREEIKLMLSRMHPDKNSGKEIYKQITVKLLEMK